MSNSLLLPPTTPEALRASETSRGLAVRALAVGLAVVSIAGFAKAASADAAPVSPGDVPTLAPTNPGLFVDQATGSNSETSISVRFRIPIAVNAKGDPITVKVAKKLLTKRDLKVGGVVPSTPKPGYRITNTVKGFAEKIVRQDKDGKPQTPLYRTLDTGKKVDPKKEVYIRRQVVKIKSSVPDTPGVIDVKPTDPGTTTPPDQETSPPSAPRELSPAEVKEKVDDYIKNNVARLPFANNCTGLVIRNDQGVPIAVVTVQHCGLNPDQKPRTRDAQGNLQITINQPLDVMVGGDGRVTELKSIGTVHEAYVPIRGQNSDLVVFALKGHTALEGFLAYEKSIISDEDLAKVDQIILPGYPVEQRKSPTTFRSPAELRRISLAVTKLTNKFTDFKIHTEIPQPRFIQDLDVLVTGINPDPETDQDPAADAICSGGHSGAVGLVPKVSGTYVAMKTAGLDVGFDVFSYRYIHTIHTPPDVFYDPIAVLENRQASLDRFLGQTPDNRKVVLSKFPAACYLATGLEAVEENGPIAPGGPTPAQISRVFEKVQVEQG